ncbi:MAG: class I SAM-dependent methyltransferase [Nitrospirota bacterium]
MKCRLIGSIIRNILHLLYPAGCARFLIFFVRIMVNRYYPEDALRFLFELDNRLYVLQGQTAVRYGNGLHTKHRHINYQEFFVKNLGPDERVLDIGSGNGFLTYKMAAQVKESIYVVGIELNESRENYHHPNLRFIHGDAIKGLPEERFDVVTLSNLLEHIEDRVEFLKNIMRQISPRRLILRVPMFERDWRVPLKKELGIDYRLDRTHCIEYRQEEFFDELQQAGLKTTRVEFRWGEIWSVVEPLDSAKSNE